MGSGTPVTYRDSSDARKSTALLMSTASTQGIGSMWNIWQIGVDVVRTGVVQVGPEGLEGRLVQQQPVLTCVGCTELTRIENCPNSTANVRIRPTTPCLAVT